ncbi:hypothetical protein CHS0354_028693 [Potamilus streckersoni]|uniref:Protein odr-4 homolog n=1 Tax=Potamilus streckersoni TaxID=2493646 RepID=A0AAE0VI37_9BIVA|nr:hypothetical protein CHS0354_028693 [Potamilus streckersoni]
MGRTVLADDRIQTYVGQLLQKGSWHLGLIIGQLTSQKDYAVHLVRTPEPVEDKASEDDENVVDEPTVKPRRKSLGRPESLDALNEQWPATHAKQVSRMLPGGLDVIGVFAMAPPAMMQSSQTKLRQIMFAIEKTQKKSMYDDWMDQTSSERILLQICSTTRKLTCRSLDVTDPKSTFRPAEWKYQSTPERWIRLQSQVAMDFTVNVPQKLQNSSLIKQIQTGLQPYCQRITQGMVTLNGELRGGNENLDQSADSKRGKGKEPSTQQTFSMELLLPMCRVKQTTDKSIPQDHAGKVILRGTLNSHAFVTTKATIAEAERAFKNDVVRSLVSRCELLCEDLDVVEGDDAIELYDTPIRVFGKLPDTSVEFCDYMFQDEKIQEVMDRIKELLDVAVTEDDIDVTSERVATEEDWSGGCKEDEEEEEEDKNGSNLGKELKYYLVAGVGILVATVAAGLTYVFTNNS